MAERKFSDSERGELLRFARGILEAYLCGEIPPVEPDIPRLSEKGGCFVSVFEGDVLRGCMGSSDAVEPLGASLARNVINASCADLFYPPPAIAELPEISIEIALPGKERKIAAPEEILNGIDAVVLKYRERKVLFLPNVISEHNWENCEILEHLSEKAGFQPDFWKNPEVEIWAFTMDECFGESRKDTEDY